MINRDLFAIEEKKLEIGEMGKRSDSSVWAEHDTFR